MSWYWWFLIGLWIGAALGFFLAALCRAAADADARWDSMIEYTRKSAPPITSHEPRTASHGIPTDGSPRREL